MEKRMSAGGAEREARARVAGILEHLPNMAAPTLNDYFIAAAIEKFKRDGHTLLWLARIAWHAGMAHSEAVSIARPEIEEAARMILVRLGCVQGAEAKGEPFPDDVKRIGQIVALAAARCANEARLEEARRWIGNMHSHEKPWPGCKHCEYLSKLERAVAGIDAAPVGEKSRALKAAPLDQKGGQHDS